MRSENPRQRLGALAAVAVSVSLSACGWWSARHHAAAPPTELIVNGAPAGSVIFVDGTAAGAALADGVLTQVVRVSPGDHRVEIHGAESVVYREQTYVASGERRVITVLSGKSP